MTGYYVVKLRIYMGDWEGESFHLIKTAFGEAGKLALEAECHGNPQWLVDEQQVADSATGFVYRVVKVTQVTAEQAELFRTIGF